MAPPMVMGGNLFLKSFRIKYSPLRGAINDSFINLRCSSSLVSQFKKATASGTNRRPLIFTSESDPFKHSSRHEGFYYTVSSEHFNRYMRAGLTPHFYKIVESFNESCVMIRSPAIEVFDCIKASNLRLPAVRYVLYGRQGCGKSTTLAHIMHYCGNQDWVVAHVPWAPMYNRYYRETQMSTYVPGRVDEPIDAALWLSHFRKMNEPLLQSLDMKTRCEYTWTKRDVSNVGTSLLELIEFGLTRTKFSCDVMGAVLKELRLHAGTGDIKLLVAIDGMNAFWVNTTIRMQEQRHLRHPSKDLTIVQHWLRLLQRDWRGGAVVCTVDGNALYPPDSARYLPLDLLTKEGFETVDPFIPIAVHNFTEKELYSFVEYFIDRKFVLNSHAQTDEGLKELMALSGGNPLQLYEILISWQ